MKLSTTCLTLENQGTVYCLLYCRNTQSDTVDLITLIQWFIPLTHTCIHMYVCTYRDMYTHTERQDGGETSLAGCEWRKAWSFPRKGRNIARVMHPSKCTLTEVTVCSVCVCVCVRVRVQACMCMLCVPVQPVGRHSDWCVFLTCHLTPVTCLLYII